MQDNLKGKVTGKEELGANIEEEEEVTGEEAEVTGEEAVVIVGDTQMESTEENSMHKQANHLYLIIIHQIKLNY